MRFLPIVTGLSLVIICMAKASPAFMVIGHRGASGYEPENTLRAFARAIEMNVDMVELDVHCCQTGELVVIHDETLDRTTNGSGWVHAYTLSALKKLDAGLGERIPTLAEVFDLVNRRVIINVELKGKGTGLLVAHLIRAYVETKGWSYDNFLVSSFDVEELAQFSQQAPYVRIGVLCEGLFLPWKACTALQASVLGIVSWRVTRSVIDQVHKRGLKIYVFTVNNKHAIERLQYMGVDGVFSNYPDLFENTV